MHKMLKTAKEAICYLYLDDKTTWTYSRQGDLIKIRNAKGKVIEVQLFKILRWSENEFKLAKKRISIQVESHQVKEYVLNNLWGIPQDDDEENC